MKIKILYKILYFYIFIFFRFFRFYIIMNKRKRRIISDDESTDIVNIDNITIPVVDSHSIPVDESQCHLHKKHKLSRLKKHKHKHSHEHKHKHKHSHEPKKIDDTISIDDMTLILEPKQTKKVSSKIIRPKRQPRKKPELKSKPSPKPSKIIVPKLVKEKKTVITETFFFKITNFEDKTCKNKKKKFCIYSCTGVKSNEQRQYELLVKNNSNGLTNVMYANKKPRAIEFVIFDFIGIIKCREPFVIQEVKVTLKPDLVERQNKGQTLPNKMVYYAKQFLSIKDLKFTFPLFVTVVARTTNSSPHALLATIFKDRTLPMELSTMEHFDFIEVLKHYGKCAFLRHAEGLFPETMASIYKTYLCQYYSIYTLKHLQAPEIIKIMYYCYTEPHILMHPGKLNIPSFTEILDKMIINKIKIQFNLITSDIIDTDINDFEHACQTFNRLFPNSKPMTNNDIIVKPRDWEALFPYEKTLLLKHKLIKPFCDIIPAHLTRALAGDNVFEIKNMSWINRFYNNDQYLIQCNIANRIIELLNADPILLHNKTYETMLKRKFKFTPQPTEEQKEIIQSTSESSISIITGLPGSGKTRYVLRGIVGLYLKKTVLAVCLSSIAALRLRTTIGIGVTFKKVITKTLWYKQNQIRNKYLDIDVLIIEEASIISSIQFSELLDCLPLVKRIIMVGDPNQMDPPDGAGELLDTFAHALQNTDCVHKLTMSLRTSDLLSQQTSEEIKQNLDYIIKRNPINIVGNRNCIDFTHGFSFIQRQTTVRQTIQYIKTLLHDAPNFEYYKKELDFTDDSLLWLTLSNDTRNDIEKELFIEKYNYDKIYYPQHFYLDEMIICLHNEQSKQYEDAGVTTSIIYNGMIGNIKEIYDIDYITRKKYTLEWTNDTRHTQSCQRFIKFEFETYIFTIHFDSYQEYIQRYPPVTMSKIQGGQAPIVVVYIHENYSASRFGTKTFYTACSRMQFHCIIVCNVTPEPNKIISYEVEDIIVNGWTESTPGILYTMITKNLLKI